MYKPCALSLHIHEEVRVPTNMHKSLHILCVILAALCNVYAQPSPSSSSRGCFVFIEGADSSSECPIYAGNFSNKVGFWDGSGGATFNGKITADSATISGAMNSSSINTGDISSSGNVKISSNASVGGTLDVTGVSTMSSITLSSNSSAPVAYTNTQYASNAVNTQINGILIGVCGVFPSGGSTGTNHVECAFTNALPTSNYRISGSLAISDTSYADVYAWMVTTTTTTAFYLNVYRVDSSGSSWGAPTTFNYVIMY